MGKGKNKIRNKLEVKKKVFGNFTLTPSHIAPKASVYRGFEGEGKCEGW